MKSIDLNDVLTFIGKANRRQKRAIELALHQKTVYNYDVTFKHGKSTREERWTVDSPEHFVGIVISQRRMPLSIERRLCYAS